MISKEFEVVKTQVSANIDLNDEKFKKIDEQMMKGANDRKGRIVDRKTFHSSISYSQAPRASQRFAVSRSSSSSFCRRTTITLRRWRGSRG